MMAHRCPCPVAPCMPMTPRWPRGMNRTTPKDDELPGYATTPLTRHLYCQLRSLTSCFDRLATCAGKRKSNATAKCPNAPIASTTKQIASLPKWKRSAIHQKGKPDRRTTRAPRMPYIRHAPRFNTELTQYAEPSTLKAWKTV